MQMLTNCVPVDLVEPFPELLGELYVQGEGFARVLRERRHVRRNPAIIAEFLEVEEKFPVFPHVAGTGDQVPIQLAVIVIRVHVQRQITICFMGHLL